MDKKKLIGTIVGVIAFIVLIAGATFAWLTVTATINNNTVTAGTTNFIVNYGGGTAITSVPVVDSSSVTTSTASKLSVTAYRASTNADGNLKINLATTSSNAIVQTSGTALKYAVCQGTCTLTGTAQTTITSSTTGLLAKGNVTSADQTLVTIDGIATSSKTYDVYFWLDQLTVNKDYDTYNNLTYAGYIYATAEQD